MEMGMIDLAARAGELLKAHGLMLATAESCTGGLIAGTITEIAGSSSWFERGFVTYSNQSKMDMLGVTLETLQQHGAVSEATVREMVNGALQHSQAQCALAVTGVAGPGGGTLAKPVGTVWFAWGLKQGETAAVMHRLDGDRKTIRQQSVCIALQGLLPLLLNYSEVV